MKVVRARTFLRRFAEAPPTQQKNFEKQLGFLLKDLRHPSLRAKIYDASQRIWQARIDSGWRFYFQIQGDTIFLMTLQPHPK